MKIHVDFSHQYFKINIYIFRDRERGQIVRDSNLEICFVYGMAMLISLYCFFNESIFTWGGYDLSVEGVVISRVVCIIFALHNFVKIFESLQVKSK